jgi:hypothetical protein
MTLDELAKKHQTDKSSLAHGYCDIYERYFGHLRDAKVNVLEIGTQFNLSIKMWAEYFHQGEIFGVDIVPTLPLDNSHVHLFQGDASHSAFWNGFARGVTFDICIDDASHKEFDQMVAFHSLWPRVKPGGWYCIEDTWTWFDSFFNVPTVPHWLIPIISAINRGGKQYHGKPVTLDDPKFDEMEQTVEFAHFFPGLLIIKKRHL